MYYSESLKPTLYILLINWGLNPQPLVTRTWAALKKNVLAWFDHIKMIRGRVTTAQAFRLTGIWRYSSWNTENTVDKRRDKKDQREQKKCAWPKNNKSSGHVCRSSAFSGCSGKWVHLILWNSIRREHDDFVQQARHLQALLDTHNSPIRPTLMKLPKHIYSEI